MSYSLAWQPDVYPDAASVARRLGSTKIVDIGCGAVGQLVDLHPEFEIVGMDYGPNIERFRNRYDFGTWLELDLDSAEPLPITRLDGCVLVCADVIEHLAHPERLMARIREALDAGADAFILSTPERDSAGEGGRLRSPGTARHIRVWNTKELRDFMVGEGVDGHFGLTRSTDHIHRSDTVFAVVPGRGERRAGVVRDWFAERQVWQARVEEVVNELRKFKDWAQELNTANEWFKERLATYEADADGGTSVDSSRWALSDRLKRLRRRVRPRAGRPPHESPIVFEQTPLAAPVEASQSNHSRLDAPALAEIIRTASPATMVPEAGIHFTIEQTLDVIARDVPGVIVECGVWRGGCSMAMLLAQKMAFGRILRRVYMLDSFEGLPMAEARDGPLARAWQTETEAPNYFDNCRVSLETVAEAMKDLRFDPADYEIVPGWFRDTVPQLSDRLPHEGISLLRLDGDWYESTMVCLEHLVPLVHEEGVVLIDDYYAWDGCARAVHDYLSREDLPYRIKTMPEGVGAYFEKRAHRSDPGAV